MHARKRRAEPGHTDGHSRNQARARHAAALLYRLCDDVYHTGKPADRVLAACFRKSRKYGSADRRLISETFFAVFRWWGWLRDLPGVNGRWPGRGSPLPPVIWQRVLAAAHLLEFLGCEPVAAQWAAEGLQPGSWQAPNDAPGESTLEQRLATLQRAAPGEREWQALVPDWLWEELPVDADQYRPLVEILQRRPPMWLRVQGPPRDSVTAELRQAGLDVFESPHLHMALRVRSPKVNLYEIPAFRAGHFEVQDFASQCIGWVCGARPGERWWDACAGAGGKSLQLAAQMGGRGAVVASDIRAWKLEDLRKRARRAGLHNISPRPWDGKRVPASGANFDGVLVDAPCTCSGTWRRNPDARWTTPGSDVAAMAELQTQILNRAATAVKPDGRLVYATCSLCRRENESVTAEFMASHPDFRPEPLNHPVCRRKSLDGLRIWPQDADSDAVFVAAFRRLRQRRK